MNYHCFFGHSYTKWLTFNEGDLYANNKKEGELAIGTYIEQKRICTKCGLVLLRKQEAIC